MCEKNQIEQLSFSDLCKALDKVRVNNGKQKIQFLKNLFETSFFTKNRRHSYQILRLLCPKQDLQRQVQNIHKNKLAKLISQTLHFSKENSDRLIYYDNPSYHPLNAPIGDFFAILEKLAHKYFKLETNLSLFDVNKYLDDLPTKESDDKIIILSKIINNCTIGDFIWFCRILLKDLQLNLPFQKILSCFHPQANDYFNLNLNLQKMCEDLSNTDYTFQQTMTLFTPVKPMLAGRKTYQQIKNYFEKNEFIIETKFDGERIQCHIKHPLIKFFSRRGGDVTHLYESLSAHLLESCSQDAILDGEMITMYSLTQQPVPFGLNRTVGSQNPVGYHLNYKIFDILYTQHQPKLISQPLNYRKKVLERIVKVSDSSENFIDIILGQKATIDEIKTFFEQSLKQKQEGIIIKQISMDYKVNERGFPWVKVKADYLDGFTDTLDLIIIGGYYTEGHQGKISQSKLIKSFLVAAKKQDSYLGFCRISSGFSDKDIQYINQMITFTQENNYLGVKNICDVYVQDIESSLILEIKGAEIIESDNQIGYTMRFPRLIKIRNDKCYKDCMEVDELIEMAEINQKMLKRKPLLVHNELEDNKRIKPNEKQPITNLFNKFIFYIVNCNQNKESLVKTIENNGGKIVANHGKHQTHVLASFEDITTKIIKKRCPQNIINNQWVYDCLAQGSILEIYPKYTIYADPQYLSQFKGIYDIYNIPFTSIIQDNLEQIIQQINYVQSDLQTTEVQETKQFIQKDISQYIHSKNCFINQTFYLEEEQNLEQKLLKILIQLNGGEITHNMNSNFDYIIQDYYSQEKKDFQFISSQQIKQKIQI